MPPKIGDLIVAFEHIRNTADLANIVETAKLILQQFDPRVINYLKEPMEAGLDRIMRSGLNREEGGRFILMEFAPNMHDQYDVQLLKILADKFIVWYGHLRQIVFFVKPEMTADAKAQFNAQVANWRLGNTGMGETPEDMLWGLEHIHPTKENFRLIVSAHHQFEETELLAQASAALGKRLVELRNSLDDEECYWLALQNIPTRSLSKAKIVYQLLRQNSAQHHIGFLKSACMSGGEEIKNWATEVLTQHFPEALADK